MARPTRDTQHRLPRWHAKRRRWRLTIEHGQGTKEFWFVGDEASTPPPRVVADAVEHQDHWAYIKARWTHLRPMLTTLYPDKCWIKPVYITADELEVVKEKMSVIYREDRREYTVDAVRSAVSMGFDNFLHSLAEPNILDHPEDAIISRIDDQRRLAFLELLRPARKRAATVQCTVEAAIDLFVKDQRERISLHAGDGIRIETFNGVRSELLRAFGMTSGLTRLHKRKTPILPTTPMHDLNRDLLVSFARYWQRLPEGVKSTRTVKNLFAAVRQFLKWAKRQSFGFEAIDDINDVLKADDTTRVAREFDPELIKKVLSHGRGRLKLYCLLGLTCGYYPKDIAVMKMSEITREPDGCFVKRERSKESGGSIRRRKGKRSLNVKHWLAPEIMVLLDRLHRPNEGGFALLNRYGLPMYRSRDDGRIRLSAAAKAWDRARERSKLDDTPNFAQLRKLGFNAIKRIAGKGGKEVAGVWAGHSSAIGEHYDDGVYQPSIEAQRVWADELRAVGIL